MVRRAGGVGLAGALLGTATGVRAEASAGEELLLAHPLAAMRMQADPAAAATAFRYE